MNTIRPADIFDIISARNAAEPQTGKHPRKMWCIVKGNGLGLASPRIYPYHKARRIAARARTMFGLDVYAVPFGHVA